MSNTPTPQADEDRIADERAAFEAWHSKSLAAFAMVADFSRSASGAYVDGAEHELWECWSARAALATPQAEAAGVPPKWREIMEQLIACHDEPTCPAVSLAKELLAAARDSQAPAAPAAPVDALRKALTELVRHFPTDIDMDAAGWSPTAIFEACEAYDAACAALSRPQAEQEPT